MPETLQRWIALSAGATDPQTVWLTIASTYGVANRSELEIRTRRSWALDVSTVGPAFSKHRT
jgi:hypothetical protein